MSTRTDATATITYRDLLLKPEHLAFAVPGLIGRLPLAMRALSCILLVQGITGNYGLAGLVGAAQTLVSAFASPRIGQLADRHGTRPVLALALLVQTAGVVALIAAAYAGMHAVVLMLAATVIGGSSVPFGSFSGARWPQHVARGRDLDRAYALEGVFGELTFIFGPAVAVFLSVEVAPPLGLIVSLVMTAIATAGFFRLPEIERQTATTEGKPVSLLRNPVILAVSGSGLGMGIVFGATEIQLVSFAEELGADGMASILIGVFAAGSLVAAALYGVVPIRQPLRYRMLGSIVWVAVWMVPTALAGSIPIMMLCMIFAGVGISPWAIATSSMIERGVPSQALMEGFGWLSAAVAAGAAAGAMAGGMAIDAWGSGGGQAVAIVGGGFAVLVTALTQSRMARAEEGNVA